MVDEGEAEIVRHIFRRYQELGCVRLLKEDLDRRGVLSKRRISKAGVESGGRSFSRGVLYALLGLRCPAGRTGPAEFGSRDAAFLGFVLRLEFVVAIRAHAPSGQFANHTLVLENVSARPLVPQRLGQSRVPFCPDVRIVLLVVGFFPGAHFNHFQFRH